ncbi:MAG: hypothetical protein HOA52_00650 [Flavobacteriales bacterium]|jgi:solute:Na+ symporter, SSS family|nr:hypothetical protein [Flavobacteriales bacterium]MBT6807982.1 hypothetical protein [Flavobacteriales bacterium]
MIKFVNKLNSMKLDLLIGLNTLYTIGIASVITVNFSVLGGFKGVVYTDFLLFLLQ